VRLILASQSPRRSQILSELGIAHEVAPAHIPEVRAPGESPEAYVERLAREKAEAVWAVCEGDGGAADVRSRAPLVILAGDTTVALGDAVLEKPTSPGDAVRILMALSGTTHRVASGLALLRAGEGAGAATRAEGHAPAGPRILSGVSVTEVRFRPFTEAEAEAYVATGEPMDKAGAYGIQGLGSTLVEEIRGDFTTVVGLPVPLLVRLMAEAGIPYRFP
jgi:septum formation protein